MHPPGQATRRAQVVEALADAVAAVDHGPPIHVAVDGLDDPATCALADDLDRRLSDRGRRCRRVTLDALSLLHPAGPGVERPAHRAGPGDDLVVVDGCFLQHPEFLGAWDLVVFLRSDPPGPPGPYWDPDQAPAAARYLTQVDPEGTADVVVDLHDPGWPVIRRMSPLLADRLGPEVFLAETLAFFAPRAATWNSASPTTTRPTRPPSPRSACTPGRPPWTRAAAPAGPCPTCGPRSARPVGSSGSTSPRRCWPPPAPTVATPTPCSPWPTPAACPCPPAGSTAPSPPACCPTSPTPGAAWPSWPGWSVPVAARSYSTPAAGPPWPPATAGVHATTTCWPQAAPPAPGPHRLAADHYDERPDRFLTIAERTSP